MNKIPYLIFFSFLLFGLSQSNTKDVAFGICNFIVSCAYYFYLTRKKLPIVSSSLKAFFWTFYLLWVMFSGFFSFLSGKKSGGQQNDTKPEGEVGLADRRTEEAIERKEETLKDLKSNLKHYEEKYKFEATLDPGSRALSLDVIQMRIEDIKSKISSLEGWIESEKKIYSNRRKK
jgi:hypothetical protein